MATPWGTRCKLDLHGDTDCNIHRRHRQHDRITHGPGSFSRDCFFGCYRVPMGVFFSSFFPFACAIRSFPAFLNHFGIFCPPSFPAYPSPLSPVPQGSSFFLLFPPRSCLVSGSLFGRPDGFLLKSLQGLFRVTRNPP